MLLQKTTIIKIGPNNKSYWSKKGYDVSKKEITVDTKDLSSGSNVSLLCRCDECGGQYFQRASRRKDICGSCRTSKGNKGNKHGRENRNPVNYDAKELNEMVSNGLSNTEIAKRLNTTTSILKRIFKEEGIVRHRYAGSTKYTAEEKEKLIEEIRSISPTTVTEIHKKTGVPKNILSYWKSQGLINFQTSFDVWKEQYQFVLDNIEKYVELNKEKPLKKISQEENISIEHLKSAFNETGNKVILHSYNKSKGELEVREFIKSLNVNCISCYVDKTYEIDCFVSEMNFGVEYCGEYWHRYVPSRQNKYYHQNKLKHCLERDITLMTIMEHEWKYKNDIVRSMIKSRLGRSEVVVYARKCTIKKIDSSTSKTFFESNHINGYVNSSINLGLFYENELVSCLSLSKSRFDKNVEYEITRFASKLNHSVIGGLSKLFKRFIEEYDPKSCLTFSDLRFGYGKSYVNCGFEHVSITNPNYWYYDKKTESFENRMKYQKSKLTRMKGFSPDKTELQIMEENGFYRVYDCGNNKFLWQKKGE